MENQSNMAHTQDSISKVLREISASVPQLLKDNAYTEESLTPTIEKVMEEALLSDNISQEKKDEVQRLKEQGYFKRKKIIENPKYVKMINDWTTKEIAKAVKTGRLPDKKQLKELEEQWKKEKDLKQNSDKSLTACTMRLRKTK